MSESAQRSLLIRNVRMVPVGIDRRGHTPDHTTVPRRPVDLRIRDGVVAEIGPGLARAGEDEYDADMRFAAPGLWDAHVHWDQWAQTLTRVDVSGSASADDVVAILARELPHRPDDGATVFGFGHRSALWPAPATVAQLDAVSDGRPVVLISGDAHNGWLNSRALEILGLSPREGVMEEREWFDTLARLDELPGARAQAAAGAAGAFELAARKGVVGIVDMEFGAPFLAWPGRVSAGATGLRVRAATYPDHLDAAIAARLRTGQALEGGAGLVRMGPLKIISDGSLNTRTARCVDPYPDAHGLADPYGVTNYEQDELTELLARAHAHGIEAAVHAIGDAAVGSAIDAFAATGARGSIEHLQLLAYRDIPRLAKYGLTASMQPAHLLDDRDVTARVWPDRKNRCFMTYSLIAEGITVALGSDAPVSPLDPWLAMSAAVFRSADERTQWNSTEAITAAQAFACSTDGRGTLAPGAPGDVILLEADPTEELGDARDMGVMLRGMVVDMTVVDGRVTHLDL